MRNVFSQLGRAVSIVAVVVLLTTPTSSGAGLLPDRDGGSGRVRDPINRIVHAIKRWIPVITGDEMIIPQP
jgi:hypothetical protein